MQVASGNADKSIFLLTSRVVVLFPVYHTSRVIVVLCDVTYADAGDDDEALEFSDSEGEWGDYDSFTDESDLEFEQEILSRLNSGGDVFDPTSATTGAASGKDQSKTEKIVNELLKTERDYVGKLHLIDQVPQAAARCIFELTESCTCIVCTCMYMCVYV